MTLVKQFKTKSHFHIIDKIDMSAERQIYIKKGVFRGHPLFSAGQEWVGGEEETDDGLLRIYK